MSQNDFKKPANNKSSNASKHRPRDNSRNDVQSAGTIMLAMKAHKE